MPGSERDRGSADVKVGAETKRGLIDLLKSKDLSPEEHQKILEIATSVDRQGTSATDEHPGSSVAKVMFVMIAVIAIVLMIGAWFMLSQMRKATDRTGPRPSKGSPAAPGGPGGR